MIIRESFKLMFWRQTRYLWWISERSWNLFTLIMVTNIVDILML